MALVSLADYLQGRRAGAGAPTVPGAPAVPGAASRPPVSLVNYLARQRSAAAPPGSAARPSALPPSRTSASVPPQPASDLLRNLGLGVGAARTGLGLMNTGSSVANLFARPERLSDLAVRAEHELSPPSSGSNALRTAGSVAGVASGALDLAQGRTVPGALQTAGGLAQLAGVPYAGLAAGVAGGAYDLAQGNTERGVANLAMTGLAYVNPALAIPGAIGKVVETIVNAGLGEGMFGQTKLPFGRGNQFSSADNLASQISKFVSLQGENMLRDRIQKAESPMDLIAMAAAGRINDGGYNTRLAPHGEIQFFHPDYSDPDAFQVALRAMVQTGDPARVRQFVSKVSIQTGEGGATTHNPGLTDWYRRQFVSLLPEGSSLRKDMTGLFEPLPAGFAGETWSWTPKGGVSAVSAPPFRPAPTPQALYEEWKARIPPPVVPTGAEFDVPTQAYNPIDMPLFAKLEQSVRDPQVLAPYLAEPTVATPAARALYEEWKSRIPPPEAPSYEYNPINMTAFKALANLVDQPPPPPSPTAPWYETMYPSLQSGGYVPGPPGRSVAATIHGGEYVVPAGPLAEELRQESRWYLSPRRGLYQSPVAQDPANDWAVVSLPPEEEDDPEPPTIVRMRAAGERPIVVPDYLYERLAPGLEPEVESFRVSQYERKHGESWEPWRPGFLPPEEAEPPQDIPPQPKIRSRPRLTPQEEDEIGAHRAGAGQGARLIPLRDYLMARATGQGDFQGAPWPEALVPGPPTPEEMRRRELTPPMRELPGSRPMTPEEWRQIQWPPSVARLI